MGNRQRKVSKYLSYVLRHNPDEINLTLDQAGWAHVETLLTRSRKEGLSIDRRELEQVVSQSEKKRFSLTEDGRFIRANYGHSIDVDLGYAPEPPPEVLFHGTASRHLSSIRTKGLLPGNRQYVHLSVTGDEATTVGGRHGRPVILTVHAREMYEAGFAFYRSDAEIWLTKRVPREYLRFPEEKPHR